MYESLSLDEKEVLYRKLFKPEDVENALFENFRFKAFNNEAKRQCELGNKIAKVYLDEANKSLQKFIEMRKRKIELDSVIQEVEKLQKQGLHLKKVTFHV